MKRLPFFRLLLPLLAGLLFLPAESSAKKRKPVPLSLSDLPFVDTVIYEFAERMPMFQGKGDINSFAKWAGQQLKYPPALTGKGSPQGKVLAAFVIEPTGELSHIEILESPHPLFSEEVIRVIKSSPPWQPGVKDNQPIRVRAAVPFIFTIAEPDRKDRAKTRSYQIPGSPSNRSSRR